MSEEQKQRKHLYVDLTEDPTDVKQGLSKRNKCHDNTEDKGTEKDEGSPNKTLVQDCLQTLQNMLDEQDVGYNGNTPYFIFGDQHEHVQPFALQSHIELREAGSHAVSVFLDDQCLVTVNSTEDFHAWLCRHQAACDHCGVWEYAYMAEEPLRTCAQPGCFHAYHKNIEECDTGAFCRLHGGHTVDEATENVQGLLGGLELKQSPHYMKNIYPFFVIPPETHEIVWTNKCQQPSQSQKSQDECEQDEELELCFANVVAELSETVFDTLEPEDLRNGRYDQHHMDHKSLCEYLYQLSQLHSRWLQEQEKREKEEEEEEEE